MSPKPLLYMQSSMALYIAVAKTLYDSKALIHMQSSMALHGYSFYESKTCKASYHGHCLWSL